jgi:hypothetical protein
MLFHHVWAKRRNEKRKKEERIADLGRSLASETALFLADIPVDHVKNVLLEQPQTNQKSKQTQISIRACSEYNDRQDCKKQRSMKRKGELPYLSASSFSEP